MDTPAKDHTVVASLRLSGSDVKVGTYFGKDGDTSVFIQTEDNPEPVYMSKVEAKLLTAALKASTHEEA